MPIYVAGDEIKQIVVGPDVRIARVYYGNKLVWTTSNVFEKNVPATATVTLTPGIYEVYCVGGGGGSAGSGGGGSGYSPGNTAEPIGGN